VAGSLIGSEVVISRLSDGVNIGVAGGLGCGWIFSIQKENRVYRKTLENQMRGGLYSMISLYIEASL
tara:strand:+ start:258 stop:458 length:201 start_codon:yes stop_codon:yes gene_type:complete